MISGASSPRVSLARTSPRTRYCCPRLLGEHVEQNVSLATSSGTRFLLRLVCATVLRRATVCAIVTGPAPRKHAPPQAVYPRRLMGVWGFYRATWSIPGRIFGAAAVLFSPVRV